ncbi:MAG: hypothetical protein QNJ38_10850 [Prochloraceae cyanobacterium]|nr:hypothetical protein [Prochloraceae cyanobacterium]
MSKFLQSNRVYSARFNETLAQAQITAAEPKKIEQVEETSTKVNGKR